jgi:hypothetical protein
LILLLFSFRNLVYFSKDSFSSNYNRVDFSCSGFINSILLFQRINIEQLSYLFEYKYLFKSELIILNICSFYMNFKWNKEPLSGSLHSGTTLSKTHKNKNLFFIKFELKTGISAKTCTFRLFNH